MKVYPLQFEPILKERIWGGNKLKTLLNKPTTSQITGESWEISTVENDVSNIINGQYKGKSLTELIKEFPEEVLGKVVYKKFGFQFPLLFKYLDAREDLSIQVHPNDELAKKRHNSFGKTEMWYVIQADKNAELIVGFKENSSKLEFLENQENKTLLSILDKKKVVKGDVFFIETGTIHAIGAGIVVAEIQQTSDITYRVYDFDRVNSDGKKRDLHVDLAIDAINYNTIKSKKKYLKKDNFSNQIINSTYFTTNYIPLKGILKINKSKNSFTVYMCVDGSFELNYNNDSYSYTIGQTILIPAEMTDYELIGTALLLEIYIS